MARHDSLSMKTLSLRRQSGVSMLFALIALTILSLAAVTLVRSVDTTTLVFGNLGFKQDATTASTRAAEGAISWMTGRDLSNSSPALGYYATSLDNLDPTGGTNDASLSFVDWDDNDCGGKPNCLTPSAEVDYSGGDGTLKARYVIARLCNLEGAPGSTTASGTVSCSQPPVAVSTGQGADRGALGYGQSVRPGGSTTGPYYRVLVRTVGGRGTVSFTETLVHF